MATKAVKKLTKVNLAPVKFNKVEEDEQKASIGDILNAGIKDYDSETMTVGLNEDENVEKQEKVQTKPQSVEELVGALQSIDKEFENVTDRDYYPEDAKIDIPNSLDLEKMEIPEIDREMIEEEATKSESAKTQKEKEILEDETSYKTELKKQEIELAKENANAKKDAVKEIYDEYKISVESDAIKRGLARSSVALLSIEGVEASRANELVKIAEKLTSEIGGLEQDILKLQQGLNSSLERLDLELAENINAEIASRIEKLEKKRDEALEFNNKVNEMEAEYQLKRLEKIDEATKLEEELAKKYQGFAENDKREKKIELALEYFSSMDKTTALNAIVSSPELASVLGDAYYDLYYFTMRRR